MPCCLRCPADDLQQLVSVYKTPPDAVFYDVVYHSYGIVPALANPAYYTCKLTSAVITSLMSGKFIRSVWHDQHRCIHACHCCLHLVCKEQCDRFI
jgi:hypothetical protein